MTAISLQNILDHKKEEVRSRREERSLEHMRKLAHNASQPRKFARALHVAAKSMAKYDGGELAKFPLIAEIKRKSPSQGWLLKSLDPAKQAKDYERGGAACLSVLTDKEYFGGDEKHLRAARDACSLPVLRKDFIIDEWQIYESRAMGADAVLLIAAAFMPDQFQTMAKLARLAMGLKMTVLTESRTEKELRESMKVERALIGINNRNLESFKISPGTTTKLAGQAGGRFMVSESGIKSSKDIARLRRAGAQAFLVGEALVKAKDPAAKISHLFNEAIDFQKSSSGRGERLAA